MKFRQKWEDALKSLYNIEVHRSHFLICNLHFHPDNLTLRGNKYELKYGAVPTIGIKSDVKK